LTNAAKQTTSASESEAEKNNCAKPELPSTVDRSYADAARNFNQQYLSTTHKSELDPSLDISSDSRFVVATEAQAGHTNDYYDVSNRSYELAWGSSFHFAPREPWESLGDSLLRLEWRIAEILQLKSGMKVIDMGCGISGPLTTIATKSGANITGVTINRYQVQRGRQRIAKQKLADTCDVMHANYMDLSVKDSFFDAAYSFEAYCHASDKPACFSELYRVVKPGAEVVIVDWCSTEKYDAANPHHVKLIDDIKIYNVTPSIFSFEDQIAAIAGAGFEIIDSDAPNKDCGNPETHPEIPWYAPLEGRDFPLQCYMRHPLWLARTPRGRFLAERTTKILERLRAIPAGSSQISVMFNRAADALVESGKLGIFDPSFLVHARKPLNDPSS